MLHKIFISSQEYQFAIVISSDNTECIVFNKVFNRLRYPDISMIKRNDTFHIFLTRTIIMQFSKG